MSRTSSRKTRGLEYRLRKDDDRAAKGKSRKYDTERLKKDLQSSKEFDKAVQKRVSNLTRAQVAVQTVLMGSRGALRYNQAREKGYGKLISYGSSIVGKLHLDDSLYANIPAKIITDSKYKKRG